MVHEFHFLFISHITSYFNSMTFQQELLYFVYTFFHLNYIDFTAVVK